MSKKYTRDQILVLIGACMTQLALLGTLVNATSVLLGALTADLGMAMTRLSSYHTLKSVATALSAAGLSALYFRSKKGLFMALSMASMVLGHLILIPGADGLLWWVSALLIGLGTATCSICVPYVLGLWFPDNAGFATGLALAFSGIGGMIFNPISSALIKTYDWKVAILVIAAVTAALAAVGIALAFGKQPPVPAQDAPARSLKRTAGAGETDPSLVKKLFPLVQAALLCGSVISLFNNYISTYATDLGYDLGVGATLVSCVMAGNVTGKLLFGAACDRWGVWRSMQGNLVIIGLSIGGFLLSASFLPGLYLSGLLFGAIYGVNMIGISRGCVEAYGQQGATKHMGTHTAIGSVIGSVCGFMVGPLYDLAGSFKPLLLMFLVILALSSAAILRMRKLLKK